MQPTSQAELDWLRTSPQRTKLVRLEILDGAEQIVEVLDHTTPERMGRIVDGSITVDTSRDGLRSCTVTIVDQASYWRVGPGTLLGPGARFRVLVGYEINGQARYWPQGVYLMQDPEVDASGSVRHIRLSGQDKANLAMGNPLGCLVAPLEIGKGRPVHLALQDLLTHPRWNETRFALAQVQAVLPWTQPIVPPQRSLWTAARDIAGIPDLLSGGTPIYRIGYDAAGMFRYWADPDPLQLSPVWSVAPVTAGIPTLIGTRVVNDTSQFRNEVVVKWGSGKGTAGVYVASSTHPTLGVAAIGARTSWWKNGQQDTLITSQAEAQARAEYQLRREMAWQQRVSVQLIENPALDPWDVIGVTDQLSGAAGNYQVLRYSISLTTGLAMPAECARVEVAA